MYNLLKAFTLKTLMLLYKQSFKVYFKPISMFNQMPPFSICNVLEFHVNPLCALVEEIPKDKY